MGLLTKFLVAVKSGGICGAPQISHIGDYFGCNSLICGAPQMPPARSPAGTLYFNRRVQRPARNDQSIRRTPDRSVPQPAFAAARVRRSPRWSGGHSE